MEKIKELVRILTDEKKRYKDPAEVYTMLEELKVEVNKGRTCSQCKYCDITQPSEYFYGFCSNNKVSFKGCPITDIDGCLGWREL